MDRWLGLLHILRVGFFHNVSSSGVTVKTAVFSLPPESVDGPLVPDHLHVVGIGPSPNFPLKEVPFVWSPPYIRQSPSKII